MKKIIGTLGHFFGRVGKDYIFHHAAYTAWFVFMSIFPLIMFLLNLMSLLSVNLRYLINQIENVVPAGLSNFVVGIIQNLYASSSELLLSVTVLIAVWAATSGIYGLMLGLNSIYRTHDRRPYLIKRGIALIYTVIFIAAVALGLLLLVFGNRISDTLSAKLPHWANLLELIQGLKYPVLFVVYAVFFNMIYTVLPYGVKSYRQQVPGSLFSAAGWLSCSWIYSLYMDHTTMNLYGSLTAVVFFMTWLYLETVIVLLGGEINAFTQELRALKHYKNRSRTRISASDQQKRGE